MGWEWVDFKNERGKDSYPHRNGKNAREEKQEEAENCSGETKFPAGVIFTTCRETVFPALNQGSLPS